MAYYETPVINWRTMNKQQLRVLAKDVVAAVCDMQLHDHCASWARNRELEKQLAEAKNELHRAMLARDAMQQERDEAQENFNTACAEVDHENEERRKLQEKLTTWQADAREARRLLADAETKLRERQEGDHDTFAKLMEAEERLSKAKAEIEHLQSQHIGQANNIASLQATVRGKHAQLNELKARVTQLEARGAGVLCGISVENAERIVKEARKYAHKWRQCKAIGIDLEGSELAEACTGLWPSDQI